MPRREEGRWLRRARRWGALCALTVAIYAYFAGGFVNNVMNNAIADLTVAIVDDHSLAIDAYAGNSNDIASAGGRLHSGFGPGLSFLLVPVYIAIKPALDVVPRDAMERADRLLTERIHQRHAHLGPSRSRTAVLLLVLAGTLGLAIPLGVIALLEFLRVCRTCLPGLAREHLVAAAFLFAFGTVVMSFATNLSHTSVAAFCLWIAVAETVASGARARRGFRAVGLGVLLGAAPTVDYQAAAFALFVGVFILWESERGRRLRSAALLLAGAIPPVLACIAYHAAVFGDAFTTAYRFRVRALDQTIFDVTRLGSILPGLANLHAALLHPFSGLVLYHPLMLLGLVATAGLAWKEPNRSVKALWYLATATITANLAIYAAFPVAVGPSSGANFAVRYTVYSVPFVVLALGALLLRTAPGGAARKALLVLAVLNAVPVWAFALYGAPVFPSRGYGGLLRQIGPGNYTLTKLHEAGVLDSPLWAWAGIVVVLVLLLAWLRAAALVLRTGRPTGWPPGVSGGRG